MTTPTGKPLQLELNRALATKIVNAVVETLSTMTGLRPSAGGHRVERSPNVHGDVSGIITLAQDQTEGVLVVSFPKETIFHILARVFRQQYSAIDASVQESVGEFTNIIYCMVKANLNNSGFNFRMALPNVIIGDHHKVVNGGSEAALVVPFSVSGYPFHVIIHLQNMKKAKAG